MHPSSSADIATAILRLATVGVSGLRDDDRRLLARLLVDESKKGAFNPSEPPGDPLGRLINHLQTEFPADGTHLVVRDHRVGLRAAAERLSGEHPPVASLILFATAIEHWLNALILTASVQRGVHEKDARVVIRAFNGPDKLKWLNKRFGFPPFESERHEAIQRLFTARNEYVHYKWVAHEHAQIGARDGELTAIVSQGGALLDYLEEYEFEQLARDGIEAAIAMFGVKRSDLSHRAFRRTA